MFARLKSLFRPLDTSQVDAAIAEASAAHQSVRVRARALRMDVCCGDAKDAVRVTVGRMRAATGGALTRLYGLGDHDVPVEMTELLGKI